MATDGLDAEALRISSQRTARIAEALAHADGRDFDDAMEAVAPAVPDATALEVALVVCFNDEEDARAMLASNGYEPNERAEHP